MAALALASSEADDVFERGRLTSAPAAVFAALTAQDLRDGRDLKTLLYEVCADIDAVGAQRLEHRAARCAARCSRCWARPSTKRPRPATSGERRGTIVASLHWCLRDRARAQEAHLRRGARAADPAPSPPPRRREKLRAPRR